MLRAIVLEVDGPRAVLLLEGERVTAETQVPLQSRQELLLQVRNFTSDQLLLRLLPTPDNSAAAQEHRLAEAARSLGLQLTASQLQSLLSLPELGRFSPRQMVALVWLAYYGLPLTPQAAQAVGRGWDGYPLSTWQTLAEAASREDSLVEIAPLLSNLTWSPNHEESATAILPHLARRLGLDYEARVAQILQAPAAEDDPQVISLTQDNLKAALLGREENQTASALLGHITHLQLVSLATAALVLVGFVATSRGSVPYLLKVKREGRDATQDGRDSYTVTIYTDPPRLGEVVVRLRLAGGELSCRPACRRAATQRLINARLAELQELLEDLTKEVKVYPCALEPQVGRQVLSGEFGFPEQGLDVRI